MLTARPIVQCTGLDVKKKNYHLLYCREAHLTTQNYPIVPDISGLHRSISETHNEQKRIQYLKAQCKATAIVQELL